ncbi:unnamed protein product [Onchocerca flexuosa]|uniref:PDEase domain-containing protein n=1 Tax=Onchocerca flexuosa TaxID=387005 RepID=A0A183HN93_9BILA|nr:unnamed protein product [Onchocerca flexuosa]
MLFRSHCSANDDDLGCLNRSLHFYEHVLLAQMKHFVAVQIHIDQWYKWHGKHRNFTEAKKELIAEFSAQLEPEDVIDRDVVSLFSCTFFFFFPGNISLEQIVMKVFKAQ